MLKYLVILLDDTSVSYCHYCNPKSERHLIPLDVLRQGILWGMKENLMIQFVYPEYEMPDEYIEVIETIDHGKIKTVGQQNDADVVIIQSWEDLDKVCNNQITVVWRVTKDCLFAHYKSVVHALKHLARLNIVITDVQNFTGDDFNTYKTILETLAEQIKMLYVNKKFVQLNLLTDRIMLDRMNNCNAGCESITLAPDARFYVCPAFYLEDDGYSVGDLESGLDIKNQQLYRLDHAPICKKCDAYQCRRCIWLNSKMTLEVNTPSREQCVISHLERNASRKLLESIRLEGKFFAGREIPEIDYLDPFEKIQ